MIDPERPIVFDFSLTLEDCRRVHMGLRLLAKEAWKAQNTAAMDLANSIAARFDPRLLKERAERLEAARSEADD